MDNPKIPKFHSAFLNEYLAMVEDTESPRLYHVWAALGGMSATLGRRCYLPFGEDKLFPNQFILLVGNPGTRKSTALSKVKARLRDNTGVRLAPTDTAGQRQGLIKAMDPSTDQVEHDKISSQIDKATDDGTLNGLGLGAIAGIGEEDEEAIETHSADKHAMLALASEFSGFIGQNNTQMLDFLTQMWDGEDYDYQIKNERLKMKNPLLNLIACTTPVSINNALPPSAGGQGMLSRFILVYGAKKYKLVPRPSAPPAEFVAKVSERFRVAHAELRGEFAETREAREYVDALYGKPTKITDSRFAYYHERRHTHLLKLGMTLAGSRGSMEIVKLDYEEADRILNATEIGMPDALGEFGLSPLALVKQHILEFLRGVGQPVSVDVIKAACHRDAKGRDVAESVNDLRLAGMVVVSQSTEGGGHMMVSAKRVKQDKDDEIQDLLAEL